MTTCDKCGTRKSDTIAQGEYDPRDVLRGVHVGWIDNKNGAICGNCIVRGLSTTWEVPGVTITTDMSLTRDYMFNAACDACEWETEGAKRYDVAAAAELHVPDCEGGGRD